MVTLGVLLLSVIGIGAFLFWSNYGRVKCTVTHGHRSAGRSIATPASIPRVGNGFGTASELEHPQRVWPS
jgi:hypothetical protein